MAIGCSVCSRLHYVLRNKGSRLMEDFKCIGEYVGFNFTCSIWTIGDQWYVRKKASYYIEDEYFNNQEAAEKKYNKLIKLAL
jgi:hypothetical protein